MKARKEISKIWISGKSSFTTVIPKRFAQELGFDSETHVTIEKASGGLLIKKLEMEK